MKEYFLNFELKSVVCAGIKNLGNSLSGDGQKEDSERNYRNCKRMNERIINLKVYYTYLIF